MLDLSLSYLVTFTPPKYGSLGQLPRNCLGLEHRPLGEMITQERRIVQEWITMRCDMIPAGGRPRTGIKINEEPVGRLSGKGSLLRKS